MINEEIARMFERMAKVLAFKGEGQAKMSLVLFSIPTKQ